MISLSPYHKAHRHLCRKDDVLKTLIARIGPCTLTHNKDGFAVLARSIMSQQISTKAAMAIGGRLLKTLGRSGLRPGSILNARGPDLRLGDFRCHGVPPWYEVK